MTFIYARKPTFYCKMVVHCCFYTALLWLKVVDRGITHPYSEHIAEIDSIKTVIFIKIIAAKSA